MKLLIATNIMNVLDSLMTAYLFRNPNNIQYEMNPIIKTLFLNIGSWVFALKTLIFLAFSMWYFRNFSNTKYYRTGMVISTIFFGAYLIINLTSIIYDTVVVQQ